MSKKSLTTLALALPYAAIIAGAALILCRVEMSMWMRIGAGAGAFVVLSVIALLVDENVAASIIAYLLCPAALGLAASAIFAELGTPTPAHAAMICGVGAGWLAVFCLLTGLPAIKHAPVLFMVIWAAAAIAGAVTFAVMTASPDGYFALVMLFPFGAFFVSLLASTEGPADIIKNSGLVATAIPLFLLVIILYIKNPAGSADPMFDLDADDPFDFEEE